MATDHGFCLSPKAEDDIIAIAEEGVRQFGAAQARKYHDELFAAFDLIAHNPRMARERRELSPPIRIHPFKAHLILYVIDEESGVFIIRIRHAHEDWSSELS